MGEDEDDDDIGLEGVYKAPIATSDYEPARVEAAHDQPFYVVSPFKLGALFMATLGTYQVYWFYKHWKCHQHYLPRKVSPFWRAVFSIFFTHSLFSTFQVRASERQPVQSLANMATLFVALSIASRVLERLVSPEGSLGTLDAIQWVVGLAIVVPLLVAQRLANIASGDPDGNTNSKFTLLNFVFLGLGSLFWLAIAASVVLPDEDNSRFPDDGSAEYD